MDLDATLSIIQQGSKSIDANSKTLCSCSEGWVDNDLCRILGQLSDAERKACREILVKHAKDLGELSRRNSDVSFAWADSPMSVQSQTLGKRGVDAVTQVDKHRVIINRQRFFDMPLMFRVALVSHELLHLVKIDGKETDDENPAPPFKNGRSMLDALGAALAMESFEKNPFDDIRELENVSRSKRRNWLYFDLMGISHPKTPSKRLLKKGESGGTSLTYTWRPNELGFHLTLDSSSYQDYFQDIEVQEELNLLGLGVDYRINPLSYYLSGWNETHIVIGLTALNGAARYQASSVGTKITDKGSVLAFKGSFRAMIPLRSNFWLSAGMDIRHVRYEYKKLHIKTIENQSIFNFGGAYGF